MRQTDMDLAELIQQWRGWIERNIGGSEARVESATQAAIVAIGQRKSRDEIVAAVHQAAAYWRESDQRSAVAGTDTRPGIVRGRVAALQQRQEMATMAGTPATLVWNFRVQREGSDGTQLPTVTVQMRGVSFEGSIINGDEVEIKARGFKPGDVIKAREIRNLTSNSRVRARRRIFLIG